jgi:PAS domain S-box-containing protein
MLPREVRLLLVDDDPSAIQVMSRMLAQFRDQRFATSGEVALRLARESTPDLILMDIEMPGMTGLDVFEELKADPTLARVPVIFATSHDSTALQVVALRKGAADFVSKPLVATQLAARVHAHLRAKLLVEDQKGAAAAAANDADAPSSSLAPRILIVDDDTASIHILRHTLAAMGDLHFAKSGEEALSLAARIAPDLILLDAHMPGIDGFDVCRSLKAEPKYRHVPVAFVTRFSDPRYEMRALDLGAADFIAKPYTAAILQARVRNLLDLKRRTDAELAAVREHWRRVGDARVADIVAAASDAIVTCDAEGKVVLINASACRMFGVQHEQAIESKVSLLLGLDLPLESQEQDKPLRTTLTRGDGEIFPVAMTVSSIGEGPDCLTTVMLRDIGDQERLEAESRSRIEAETAGRTKTLMMSYIAHEMGNPLNGLLGFADLMVGDAGAPLPPAQARRLQHIVTSGRHLQGLMRDVMDIGRFETGNMKMDLRVVDANRCVQEAVSAVSAQAEQAGVTLSGAPPSLSAGVLADGDRLHQCLVNLLTNAVKYNRPGGWARIELVTDAQHVGFVVRDNGLGLKPTQLERLFEPFNRLGREQEPMPGAGLGLVITRQLVQAMNGQLRVESEPGQGSSFSIELPRSPDAAQSHG